jgi:hypothetical protein
MLKSQFKNNIMNFKGFNCYLKIGKYHNKNIKLDLIDIVDNQKITTCTFNFLTIKLKSNEILIKDYSENKGMLQFLIDNKIISDPIKYVHDKFPICKFIYDENKDILELIKNRSISHTTHLKCAHCNYDISISNRILLNNQFFSVEKLNKDLIKLFIKCPDCEEEYDFGTIKIN